MNRNTDDVSHEGERAKTRRAIRGSFPNERHGTHAHKSRRSDYAIPNVRSTSYLVIINIAVARAVHTYPRCAPGVQVDDGDLALC